MAQASLGASFRPASGWRLGRLLLIVLTSLFCVSEASAAKRVALVIGIDGYQNLPKLEKAVSDARAVGAVLADIGFNVIAGENLTRRDMNRKLADLEAAIGPGDTVFFFFAGHGIALGAENILLAADMPRPGNGEEGLVRDEGYSVDAVIRRVQAKGALLTFFVLDACRDNPLEATGTRNIGGSRGLARVEAPRGVFVLYSAGIGQTALDTLRPSDPDPNSVFTRKLVPLLRTPGLSHVGLAKRVQQEVDALAATVRHAQQPAYYDQIVGEIVLQESVGAGAEKQQPAVSAARESAGSGLSEEQRRQTDLQIAEERRRREQAEASATAALETLRRIEEQRRAEQTLASACPATFSNLKNRTDEISCHCPASSMTGTVWGTNIYTHDSSICAAARHAGVLPDNGGVVRMRAAPGRASYAGSRRNGVTTSNWDQFDGSFVFTSQVVVGGAQNAEAVCPSNVTAFRGREQRVKCYCAPQEMSGTVWGSGIYTDDSSVCHAALHAGVIDRNGGEVTLSTLPGRSSYAGSSRNGVRTQSYGRWQGSFRFVQ
jgi:uncharacterized caspase-like protein